MKQLRGQAAVEMAFVLPLLLLLAFGFVDLGRVFYFQEAIANAAREGARYGSATGTSSTTEIEIHTLMEAGALSSSISVDSVEITVETVTVGVSYQFDLVTPLMQDALGMDSILLRASSVMPSAPRYDARVLPGVPHVV